MGSASVCARRNCGCRAPAGGAIAPDSIGRLNEILRAGDFDAFVERTCQKFYAARMGPSECGPRAQAEHAVALDTGAVVAVTMQDADDGDTTTMQATLIAAR